MWHVTLLQPRLRQHLHAHRRRALAHVRACGHANPCGREQRSAASPTRSLHAIPSTCSYSTSCHLSLIAAVLLDCQLLGTWTDTTAEWKRWTWMPLAALTASCSTTQACSVSTSSFNPATHMHTAILQYSFNGRHSHVYRMMQ